MKKLFVKKHDALSIILEALNICVSFSCLKLFCPFHWSY